MAAQHADAHHASIDASFTNQTTSGHDITVRSITPADLVDALRFGLDDFKAQPSHMFVLGLVYAFGAAVVAGLALGRDFLPLVFPIASGFALTGPFAAIILYEISRQREDGHRFVWSDTGQIFKASSSWAVATLGLALFAAFGLWLLTAQAIFNATIGNTAFMAPIEFIRLVLTTPEGWALIVMGNGAGFLFAAIVLATNVVSFPMLLDRNVGAATAVSTSLRVTAANPLAIALWGLIIAGSMLIGFLSVVGLAVILPVIGHASWHVYRKAVAR